MPKLIVKMKFDVRISRFKDGSCYCGSDPNGLAQTFTSDAGLMRDDRGSIVDNGMGTDTDDLWNSAETIQYKKLDVLACTEGHYYVTRSANYKGA